MLKSKTWDETVMLAQSIATYLGNFHTGTILISFFGILVTSYIQGILSFSLICRIKRCKRECGDRKIEMQSVDSSFDDSDVEIESEMSHPTPVPVYYVIPQSFAPHVAYASVPPHTGYNVQ
eukprot:TRINITY_DN5292_c0_g1_i1.p1 TRINITY_DN5292_c0_g1~~TRINITY_DN5292_c0_g1_i1.p1  ORF type:complete len:121 (-),score=9.00 TRINITY_DN5292_c0_g1_i1:61-423(-)